MSQGSGQIPQSNVEDFNFDPTKAVALFSDPEDDDKIKAKLPDGTVFVVGPISSPPPPPPVNGITTIQVNPNVGDLNAGFTGNILSGDLSKFRQLVGFSCKNGPGGDATPAGADSIKIIQKNTGTQPDGILAEVPMAILKQGGDNSMGFAVGPANNGEGNIANGNMEIVIPPLTAGASSKIFYVSYIEYPISA